MHNQFILAVIRAYQRYLSPYKGFSCAYRAHTGRSSCSALGYRAIQIHGALAGFVILRERLYLCGVAHRRFTPPRLRPHLKQRGDCDIGCDGCDGFDFPSGKGLGNVCDFLSYCDAGCCEWPDRKRKKQDQEKYVYIPPKTTR
jgi:putative component of membrane protein insertase Oxa1/YidC/SpoIIIJ protein YidD